MRVVRHDDDDDCPTLCRTFFLIMRYRYAIWNTVSIDGDGTTVALETANHGFFS